MTPEKRPEKFQCRKKSVQGMSAIFAIFGTCVPTFHGRSEPLPHVRETLHALQSMKSIRMVKKYRDKSGRPRVASNLVGL